MAFRQPRCNCPDAANKRGGNPGADTLSEQIPSDWSSGFNGIRSTGGYCIHELAVLRIRKEVDAAFPGGIPKDLRASMPPRLPQEKLRYKLQTPSRLGDDFS